MYDEDERSLGSKWNDMEWHTVKVRWRVSELSIQVDDVETVLADEEKREEGGQHPPSLTLYFGGMQHSESFGRG